MMNRQSFRFALIAAVLALAAIWTVASAETAKPYANQRFVATPSWLVKHLDDPKVVLVDVRNDKHFDGKVITGAIRMPWTLFRYNDKAENIGGAFAGPDKAQDILGAHGITRDLEVVLYDDLKRDGGATASYVFWILDVLGHPKMRVLEGGIEAWIRSGGKTSQQPATHQEAVYQAPSKEIVLRRWREGPFIYDRLGDPYYQIMDVRSQAEYLGEAPNAGLDGRALKLGHIPGAYNVDYRLNWKDSDTKALKNQAQLGQLYAGLNPNKGVVVYCHSGRRSAYSYYVLRVMGFKDVICYGRSWNEWGAKGKYFPVETKANPLSGKAVIISSSDASSARTGPSAGSQGTEATRDLSKPVSSGGYISCGG